MKKRNIGAGTVPISDMSDGKQKLILCLGAAAVFVSVLLFNIFDSPRFSPFEGNASPSATAVTGTEKDDGGLININTASAEELASIKGIGEKRAESIIEYRLKNGRFLSISELENIEGIGKSTIEKISDMITV